MNRWHGIGRRPKKTLSPREIDSVVSGAPLRSYAGSSTTVLGNLVRECKIKSS